MLGRNADFGELFRMEADGLYRFALIRLRNEAEAEDAVQDAFLRLCRRADDPRDFDNPRAWMFRVLESVCLDRRRAMSRRERVIDQRPFDPEAFSDPAAASAERRASIAQDLTNAIIRLRALPEADAVALALVAIEGMSYADVAEIVQIPIGTVRSRVSRARQSLRRMRDDAESEPEGDPAKNNVVSISNRARRGSE